MPMPESCTLSAKVCARGSVPSSGSPSSGRAIFRRTAPACVNLNALPSRLVRRSEEHTSELQSLMRISYAVFCLKKKNNKKPYTNKHQKIANLQQSQVNK